MWPESTVCFSEPMLIHHFTFLCRSSMRYRISTERGRPNNFTTNKINDSSKCDFLWKVSQLSPTLHTKQGALIDLSAFWSGSKLEACVNSSSKWTMCCQLLAQGMLWICACQTALIEENWHELPWPCFAWPGTVSSVHLFIAKQGGVIYAWVSSSRNKRNKRTCDLNTTAL